MRRFRSERHPALISPVADDTLWEYAATSTELPWYRLRHGKAGASTFFQSPADFEVHLFNAEQKRARFYHRIHSHRFWPPRPQHRCGKGLALLRRPNTNAE